VADDPGRQIRKPYLGPKGMRFPFNWTLEEMGLAFMVLLVGMVLLVFVVPAGAVVAAVTWFGGRSVARLTSPDSPRKRFRLIAGLVAVICLLISFHPMTWIGPLFFPLAVVAGLVLPIYVIRHYGRFLNWNRPFRYWLRLPRLVAAGPREMKALEVNVAPLMITAKKDSQPPLTGTIVEKRLVPLETALVLAPQVKRKQRGRHKYIERSPNGFYVGKTEFRVEWTF
jgi:hypothetical protein